MQWPHFPGQITCECCQLVFELGNRICDHPPAAQRVAFNPGKQNSITDAARVSRRARLAGRLAKLCATDWSDPDAVRLSNRLDKYADGIFTFLDYDDVPHTNNHADKGAHTQAVLMSIYRNLKMRGLDPVKTIIANLEEYLLTGQLPPLPEKTDSDS